MQKYIIWSFIAIFPLTQKIYAQTKEFNVANINIDSKKATRIFVTAIWCSPCMGKYKIINKEFSKDTIYNNIVLFDASGFSLTKLKRITSDNFDSSCIYTIPYKFYESNKLIVFNLPEKVLKRFINDLKIKFPKNNGLANFWFGDFLIIDKNHFLTSEKVKI